MAASFDSGIGLSRVAMATLGHKFQPSGAKNYAANFSDCRLCRFLKYAYFTNHAFSFPFLYYSSHTQRPELGDLKNHKFLPSF